MTGRLLARRQRWAAFSVRAHRDLGALASDLLLYERLILPVPADEDELTRWELQDWDPELLALRKVQGAELIYTVPWTTELRAEHAVQMGLQKLNGEIGYGMTAGLLTTSAAAWSEILGGLAPDQVPEERPFLIAAYQSEAEARAALHLRPAGRTNGPMPGDRPADSVLATKVVEMLDEPVQQNPEEAFLAAVSLSSDPDFVKARRALFSYVDGLAIDESPETEIATTLSALERDYNEAVHQFTVSTRKRRAVTLLPRALGAVAQLAGVPFAKTAGGGISTVAGHFVPAPSPVDEPGKALAMIRAAFRD